MYGASTGEWGEPSQGVITEMEMGFIEPQRRTATSAKRPELSGALLTARLPPGPQYTPNYYVLKTITMHSE